MHFARLTTRLVQVLLDALVVASAFVISYAIRFEAEQIPLPYMTQMWTLLPYVVGTMILLQAVVGVYSLVWRYVSLRDCLIMSVPPVLLSLGLLVLRFNPYWPYPVEYPVPLTITFLFPGGALAGMVGMRILRRLVYEEGEKRSHTPQAAARRKVLLVGAGAAGILMAKEVSQRQALGLTIVGFVDDDRRKLRTNIQGIPVLGRVADLTVLVKRLGVDEVIITIASASRTQISRIVNVCEKVPVKVRIVPGVFEMLQGKSAIAQVRDVQIEDLLGREAVRFEADHSIRKAFQGKSILVTGAGGSIGSELCRQLLTLEPKELLLLDKDENSLYEIDHELQRRSRLGIVPCLADIRNPAKLEAIFRRRSPQVIFHAAAYKHVPMMEANSCEGVLNNVFGTKTLVDLADKYSVENFVMISTDKAVNPISVMGATKRVAEMVVQRKSRNSATVFSCVRFGNVLDSKGSVVPLFRRQIAEGGPITVTHPDVKRYFMTIPEAVALVIQAGSLGKQGEIFVLDMGQPIKITDLARQMIALAGLEEGQDIAIEFCGLRPGEKLFVELFKHGGSISVTRCEKIRIAAGLPEPAMLAERLALLEQSALANDDEKVRQYLKGFGLAQDESAVTKSGESRPSSPAAPHPIRNRTA